jgi:beta-lactamase regulating signal transducer with metallopeptidase domain
MLTKLIGRSYLPLVAIFLLLNLMVLVFRLLAGPSPAYIVILLGNLILFIATLLSFNLYRKSLLNNNVQVFLRLIYSGLFLKMIICITAALVYILIVRNAVSKIAVFGCFGFYFIYTFAEVKILMRLNKHQKNA